MSWNKKHVVNTVFLFLASLLPIQYFLMEMFGQRCLIVKDKSIKSIIDTRAQKTEYRRIVQRFSSG